MTIVLFATIENEGGFAMASVEAIRSYCLSFPGAYEDHPWGEAVFKAGKKIFVFAALNTALPTVTVKLTPELRDLWLQSDNAFIPAYVGRYGWCGIRLTGAAAWNRAEEGIAVSYHLVTQGRPPRPRV